MCRAAGPALDDRRHVVDDERAAGEVGAVGQQLPRELQRVGNDLAEVADANLDPLDPVPVGVASDGVAMAWQSASSCMSGPPCSLRLRPVACRCAGARDRNAVHVDCEAGVVLERTGEVAERRGRDLGDGPARFAHEVAVVVVGPVIDGGVAVE